MYLVELNAQVQRSEIVGAITLDKGSVAVLFDNSTRKFTLVEKSKDSEDAAIYECVPSEKRGRNIMLIGHTTQSGGFIASGHATLEDNLLKIKLASGCFYRIEVDPNAACFQHFLFIAPNLSVPKRSISRRSPFGIKGGKNWKVIARPKQIGVTDPPISSKTMEADVGGDFTEEDLMRLRGDIVRTSKSNRKVKHRSIKS